jgi:2-dehydropantoate 2-reductase
VKVAVLGAGAIGAFLGASMSRGGVECHLVARGPQLEALRRDGVTVLTDDGSWNECVPATDDPRTIGPVDFVVLGLKAHSYADAGPLLAPLLGPDTAVAAAQNGIPWWYFHRHGGPFDGRRIEAVDPGGAVSDAIPPARAIGCVVYPATEIVEPGVIRHIEGRRIAIGEPDRAESERCRRLREALVAGGLRCRIERDLRPEIWLKLLGNAAFNPISGLTGATMGENGRHVPARELARTVMEETLAVATALGARPSIDVEQRLAGAAGVGDHRTSMLQDLDAGRPLELDVLLAAVVEMGELVRVRTPSVRALLAATSLRAELGRGARGVPPTAGVTVA